MQQTWCLYTTFRNTSGAKKHFAFLPPHGRTLEANEEITFLGDPADNLIRFDVTASQRFFDSFDRTVGAGDIKIVKTPNPIMVDEDEPLVSRMLIIRDNKVDTDDPCFDSLSV